MVVDALPADDDPPHLRLYRTSVVAVVVMVVLFTAICIWSVLSASHL
jgi:hypothetical protein